MNSALHQIFRQTALLWFSFLLAACEPALRTVEPASTWFPMRLGNVEFVAQLAISQEEMAQGLMHRAKLDPDAGMLFVYPDAAQRAFWMKNTHIPLDLGFFTGDGVLDEIRELRPYDLTPVPSRSNQIAIALEVNRGWFEQKGIAPGAKLDLRMLAEALEKRGERELAAHYRGVAKGSAPALAGQ